MELIDLARLDDQQASGFPGSDEPSSGVLELQIRAAIPGFYVGRSASMTDTLPLSYLLRPDRL